MISIIIPSYNSEKTILSCLHSLQNQSYTGDFEIILVDSSNDRTMQIVPTDIPKVKLIHLNNKTDPGTARNIGIKESKSNLIAFIDSDCIAANDWIENIQNAHKLYPYNIIGGVIKNGNKKNDTIGWAGYLLEFREFLPDQSRREVPHIPTCNISYKRQVFQKFGLFEGDYYPQEDLVYNYNLLKNGEKILLDPNIKIYHHHRSRLKDFLNHQIKIGKITSRVLKILPLEGASIPRHPFIALFIIPLLPIVKLIRTLSVFLRYNPKIIIFNPHILIILIFGITSWVIGFTLGIYKKKYF